MKIPDPWFRRTKNEKTVALFFRLLDETVFFVTGPSLQVRTAHLHRLSHRGAHICLARSWFVGGEKKVANHFIRGGNALTITAKALE